MVKRRTKIEKIEDKSKRQVTFTKRRQGLCKKAYELSKRCDAQVAVISISEAGKVFAFGHPSVETVDSIVQRYKETTKPESSSGRRDDDDQQQVQEVQYLLGNEDESPVDHDDRQEVQEVPYLLEKDDESPDDRDDLIDLTLRLSLPMINCGENEDESSGMIIKNSETEKGLANLPAGGIEKNKSNQEEQHKKVVEEGEHSISGSKMIMMPLLRDVPVENLDLHELEQLIANIEQMQKKVMDRANQIKRSSNHPDSSMPCGSGTH